jgi:hypothetical protein
MLGKFFGRTSYSLIKDLPISLTNIIENLYEAAIILGHYRDGAILLEDMLDVPLLKATEHAKVIHETSYYKGYVTHFQWVMGGLQ